MKRISCIILVLILTLVFSLPVVASSDASDIETVRYSISANDQQIDLLKDLWGQKMTKGEFLKMVFPKHYEQLPPEIKEYVNGMQQIWPLKPSEVEKQKSDSSETVEPKGPVVVRKDSTIDNTGSLIEFESYSNVWYPPDYKVPYMEITSSLWRGSDENDVLLDFEFESATYVKELSAAGNYYVSTPGWHMTTGVHFFEFESGPSSWVSDSGDPIWVE